MGRIISKLKPFIEESLRKNYINFKKEKDTFELYTPRFKKNSLDPAFEKIFKAYEEHNNRTYLGYKENKDTLKSAIRRSKYYEVISTKEHKFLFRERTLLELENLKQKKESKNVLKGSPASSGYESSDCHPTTGECGDMSGPLVGESQDVSVEESKLLEMKDEELSILLNDVLSDDIPVKEMEQYCQNNDISMDVEEHGVNSADDIPVKEMEQCCQNKDISVDVEEHSVNSSDSTAYEWKKFNVYKYKSPEGKSIIMWMEE